MEQFKPNKYTATYYRIIDQAKSQGRVKTAETYLERHHVIPRSMGGSDSKSNLVNLTYREHFLCHWLLTKMVDGKEYHRMLSALSKMRRARSSIITSWQYAISRKAASLRKRGTTHSDEIKKKISDSKKEYFKTHPGTMTGKKHSEETLAKQSQAKSGENHPNFGKKRPEHATKVSKAMKGKAKSESHKRKIADGWQESRERVQCIHCKLITTKGMATRWHGANCKLA